jgi:4-amino-4-deoxy-L-arabinose transferase-like glycosyltransferase
VLCARRNPEFLRVFFLEHNVERYLTPVFRHVQPVWFFALVLPLALLPWTALLVTVFREWFAQRSRPLAESPGALFACWVLFPLVFFSASQSKLPGYILPAIPACILLMARGAARGLDSANGWARSLCIFTGVTFAAVLLSARWWLAVSGGTTGSWNLLSAWNFFLLLGSLAIVALGLARRPVYGIILAGAMVSVVLLHASRAELPRADAQLSSRAAAEATLRHPGAREAARIYDLPHARRFGLEFYLRRELQEWTLNEPAPDWLFTTEEGLRELERHGINERVEERTSAHVFLVRIER